ncbi:hypothetical protein VSVS12_02735 [Vibrio scophthalmi]|uniref:zonular occludens toxin domain-containing protein n=1 Tax=Vibrio scophthalmi TaxID=45658 RepID=UPI0008092090|nr:zonular occludens toxin domain-containing protein [Vibrio scophthalmi]ANS86484.1 hypothetical protein VSVS12_02735 [Vibrio scophthalmi]
MAVFMVYGKPGSGKSCWTVQNVVLKELIQKQRKIITNLSLNVKYLTEVLDVDKELIRIVHSEKGDFSDTFLKASDYLDDWRNDKGQAPVVIVDEAHFSLNKQRKKDEVIEIEEFFSTHRQAGYDIYLITQDPSRIPSDVLGFVETFYQVKKQRQIGKNSFSVYVRDCDRQRTIIGQKTGTYPKDVFKCYKSHLLSKGEIDEDSDVNGIKSIWFTWPFICFYIMIAGLVYGFTLGGLSLNPFSFLNDDKDLNDGVELDKLEMVSVENNSIQTLQTEPLQNFVDSENINSVVVEKQEPVEIKYLNQSHPFDGKLLQIRNWIGDIAFISVFDKETKEMVSSLKSDSFEKMGYVVDIFSECSMKLTYENINFFVDCSEIKKEEEKATDQILGNIPTI